MDALDLVMADAAAFFDSIRSNSGPLTQPQVDGMKAILMGCYKQPLAFTADILGQSGHETNATMQPVVEAYWLSEEWRAENLDYYPWYGRGFVQLTWEENYQRADDELGMAGALIADPD